jgi:hypothetical protein
LAEPSGHWLGGLQPSGWDAHDMTRGPPITDAEQRQLGRFGDLTLQVVAGLPSAQRQRILELAAKIPVKAGGSGAVKRAAAALERAHAALWALGAAAGEAILTLRHLRVQVARLGERKAA